MKWRSQVGIPLPPSLVWICQKKKRTLKKQLAFLFYFPYLCRPLPFIILLFIIFFLHFHAAVPIFSFFFPFFSLIYSLFSSHVFSHSTFTRLLFSFNYWFLIYSSPLLFSHRRTEKQRA